MNDVQQLVHDVAEVTGASLPALLDEQSPALRTDALPSGGAEAPYLVGIIGGKDVGKSALVNALVGDRITASTAYGPGTEDVVAYVHDGQVDFIRPLLEREAPGRHKIVVHSILRLHRQVLLDLPDVDSIYDDHLELTRRMLRHMLFPIWVQSIEKYADLQPQKLLAAVSAGNDPQNFLFVLNKADQLGEQDAQTELREDYARRIARTLKLAITPQVYLLSATNPGQFDLPGLREKLAQQKSSIAVKQSIDLAGRQRDRSMLAWLDDQQLDERVKRIQRLETEAQDLVTSRLAGPLLERAVPAILDDPTHKAAIIDQAMTARVSHWPIVNVLHTLLSPLTALWRTNAGTTPTAESLVAARIDPQGRSLSNAVQATFALLQQTHPLIASLYRRQKLWEQMPADQATGDLREHLVGALEAQRAEAIDRFARGGFAMPIVRWLLTIGAAIWFPIVQPVAEVMLRGSLVRTTEGIALLVVQLLGATYLLKSAAFLGIWFLVLWLILRWDTQRRINRMLARWRRTDGDEGARSIPTAVMNWVDELLDPIHVAARREETLAQKAETLRREANS